MRGPERTESRRRATRAALDRALTQALEQEFERDMAVSMGQEGRALLAATEQRYRDSEGALYEEPLVQRGEPGLFDDLQSFNEPMHPLTKLSIALLVITLSGALGGALVQLLVVLIRWSEVPHG